MCIVLAECVESRLQFSLELLQFQSVFAHDEKIIHIENKHVFGNKHSMIRFGVFEPYLLEKIQ